MDGSGVTLLIVIGFFMFAVTASMERPVLQRNRKSEEHLRMWNISLKRGAGEADYRKRRDWLWGESLKGKE